MSDDLQVTATERALLGDLEVAEVDAWIDRVLMHLVGARPGSRFDSAADQIRPGFIRAK